MTAADFLIQNGGRLDPSWYAPLVLTDLLTAWLAGATGSDQQVEAAVYTRGFETVVSLIMSRPTKWAADDVSESFSDEQLRYWQAQAAYWRGKDDALNGSGSGPVLVGWEEDQPLWRN